MTGTRIFQCLVLEMGVIYENYVEQGRNDGEYVIDGVLVGFQLVEVLYFSLFGRFG
jgi:hypothetical protein